MADKAGFIPQKNRNDLTGQFAKLVAGRRVSVVIDAANLYYASSVSKIKIDYFQVASWFKTNCKTVNLNFYTAFDPEDVKQIEFFETLEASGYNVVKKPIKVFEDSKKGNMDIELAVDAVTQKDSYDILILLSGDGDFTYLISALEILGKETIILGIGGFTSYELHQEAGRYFFLNRISHVWRKFFNKTSETGEQEESSVDNGSQEEGVIILGETNSNNNFKNFSGFENIPAKLAKTRTRIEKDSDSEDKTQLDKDIDKSNLQDVGKPKLQRSSTKKPASKENNSIQANHNLDNNESVKKLNSSQTKSVKAKPTRLKTVSKAVEISKINNVQVGNSAEYINQKRAEAELKRNTQNKAVQDLELPNTLLVENKSEKIQRPRPNKAVRIKVQKNTQNNNQDGPKIILE